MSEHANVELIRRGYEAFGKGDMQTVDELFADDIVWHNGGRGPLSGDRRSKKEVFEFFGELAQRSDGTFGIDIHDVVGGDDHVVVISTAHATGMAGPLKCRALTSGTFEAAKQSSFGICSPIPMRRTNSGRNSTSTRRSRVKTLRASWRSPFCPPPCRRLAATFDHLRPATSREPADADDRSKELPGPPIRDRHLGFSSLRPRC